MVSDPTQPAFPEQLKRSFGRKWQGFLDSVTPWRISRWVFLAGLVGVYALRVYMVQGFFIVTYGLGIFLLNLLIGFLTPLEEMEYSDGPSLPTSVRDAEFRPFVRRLSEFKFW